MNSIAVGSSKIAGTNLTVLEDQAGGYRVRTSRGLFFKRRNQWTATVIEVDALEQALLAYLSTLNTRRVVSKMDYYGNLSIVVRRGVLGLLGKNVIRLPRDRMVRVTETLKLD
jgi:hypothetical protein